MARGRTLSGLAAGWSRKSRAAGTVTSRGAAVYSVRIGLLVGLYIALAQVGLSVGSLPGNVAPVWPPTGAALAALVLLGRRYWPGVALGSLLFNIINDVPVSAACGMALGNTLEALIGASLLGLVPGFRPSLQRVVDVVALAVLAAGLSTAVSASIGTASLTLAGVVPVDAYWDTWQVWWVGDALGALVVAPVILAWARPGTPGALPSDRWGGLAIVVSVSVVTLGAFSGPVDHPYLIFPLLVGAALLLRQRGATAGMLALSATAVAITAARVGPFVTSTTIENLWALDTFLAVVALTTLLLAAVVSERDHAAVEALRLARQLRVLADTDPLTGLANRRSFEAALERQVADVTRYGPAGALLVLDIDQLKPINDSLGHKAGDEVILAVAEILRGRLRDTDVISRLGGDEFAIILPRANQLEAGQVANTLVGAVRRLGQVLPDHQNRRTTVSVGVAMFDSPVVPAADMLVQADMAMYEAKQAGRDRSAMHCARPHPD